MQLAEAVKQYEGDASALGITRKEWPADLSRSGAAYLYENQAGSFASTASEQGAYEFTLEDLTAEDWGVVTVDYIGATKE